VPVGAVTAAVRDTAAGCVLVSTEIPGAAVVAAVRGARVSCVLNPAPVIDEVLELLDAGPILTPNRSECLDLAARLGTATDDVVSAARRIQERSGAPVLVTLGGDGVLVLLPGAEPRTVPARPVRVRDTTGAGDTFNGVLAARLAAGAGPVDAVRTAVVAASLSVTRVGARAGMPTAAEIGAFATD
jgi:ribokinase